MMWQDEFAKKSITAQQAANLIKSGDRICTGNRDCRAVLKKLVQRTDLKDVFYYEPIINYIPDAPAVGDWFTVTTSFLNDSTYKLHDEKRVSYIPGDYWQWYKLAIETFHCNVAFLEVSKPDEHGYMSLGTCADMVREAARKADLVICETNSHYPFVEGTNVIHISEVDYVVDADAENFLLLGDPLDVGPENAETYKKIGGYLSELIPDEATIEVGLGRLNAASLMYLDNKRDLGVHTEVYGDILMKLTERGIITNLKKTDKPGKAVFTQVVGSQELFDWLDHNQGVSLDNCTEALHTGTIFRQRRMTAINNAVEVDLMGQANAEFLKGKQFSGTGGILNFACGASANPEGKSIVVLESMTRNGKYSKITPAFKPGTPVSLPRTAIEYVVTEQGIAELVGKSPEERTKALIQVAHPKFREELTAKAKELGMI